jgi:hypothetical protein
MRDGRGRALPLDVAPDEAVQLADEAATHEAAEVRLDLILTERASVHGSIVQQFCALFIGQRSDCA